MRRQNTTGCPILDFKCKAMDAGFAGKILLHSKLLCHNFRKTQPVALEIHYSYKASEFYSLLLALDHHIGAVFPYKDFVTFLDLALELVGQQDFGC